MARKFSYYILPYFWGVIVQILLPFEIAYSFFETPNLYESSGCLWLAMRGLVGITGLHFWIRFAFSTIYFPFIFRLKLSIVIDMLSNDIKFKGSQNGIFNLENTHVCPTWWYALYRSVSPLILFFIHTRLIWG